MSNQKPRKEGYAIYDIRLKERVGNIYPTFEKAWREAEQFGMVTEVVGGEDRLRGGYRIRSTSNAR